MALGWIGSTTAFGRCRQEAIDMMRPRYGLRFGAAITVECRPDTSESERRSVFIDAKQTTSFFLVSGFGSAAYSAKLLNGTGQRFSGFSQPRECTSARYGRLGWRGLALNGVRGL